jgi:hypothetical protein
MVSLAFENGPSVMVGLLEGALHALVRLRVSADRLRHAAEKSAQGQPVFSMSELEQLCIVIERGWNSVLQRLLELSPGDRSERGARWASTWRASLTEATAAGVESAARDKSALTPQSLLATYRASCRALCAALTEARHVADATTAAMLSGLLQRLEKQLWLLDASHERPRVGAASAINLFLSC